jgi:hypothetical protein
MKTECIMCRTENNVIFPYVQNIAICTLCFNKTMPKFAQASQDQLLQMYSLSNQPKRDILKNLSCNGEYCSKCPLVMDMSKTIESNIKELKIKRCSELCRSSVSEVQ